MSNTNTNLQTQTSNALHNAIMEAGGKDCPPMLAPDNYVQWKSRIKRYIDTKPNNELIYYCLQNPPYKFKWTEKTVPVVEAEAVQIILTGIDNDIYSTVDACPKKIYKPTNKNLRTSSKTSRAHQDNTSRINKGTGHVAKECQKPKRPKDAAYHKENMLLCKQEEAEFQLNAEQADWRDDTDDEPGD
ncbi:hypothetical protein Tco_0738326 [Tanacetum coccineum]